VLAILSTNTKPGIKIIAWLSCNMDTLYPQNWLPAISPFFVILKTMGFPQIVNLLTLCLDNLVNVPNMFHVSFEGWCQAGSVANFSSLG